MLALVGQFLAMFALILGAVNYMRSSKDRKKEKHYAAWQVILAARGARASGGRLAAVRDLANDKVSLHGIDLAGAFLDDLDLEHTNLVMSNFKRATLNNAGFEHATMFAAHMQGSHGGAVDFTGADLSYADFAVVHFLRPRFVHANLARANFEFANLHEANMSSCDLEGAHLRGANLYGADLSGIKNWKTIQSLEHANILEVKNAPHGFREWALKEMHAEEITVSEWLQRHEKAREHLRGALFG